MSKRYGSVLKYLELKDSKHGWGVEYDELFLKEHSELVGAELEESYSKDILRGHYIRMFNDVINLVGSNTIRRMIELFDNSVFEPEKRDLNTNKEYNWRNA